MTDTKARYIMIGGFLGAGKTTAILKLAEHLAARGLRSGLITNDQSIDLVDTARARAAGFPVSEITGGCFCCKFDTLVEASQQLTRENRPDVLIAEPVGSCTDLKATVSYPLRQLYGDAYQIAPLSVLVDPLRCARILGLAEGRSFSDKVIYVYRKQLEEAEILVVNKIDLIDNALRSRLCEALAAAFPRARVMEISCRTGEGMEAWFDRITTARLGNDPTMQVDYDEYADGEARLGWLNCRVAVMATADFDGNELLARLASGLRDCLAARNVEIAHLKMTLAPDEGPDLGAISLTQTDASAQPTHTLKAPLRRGTLILNLRAEMDPQLAQSEVRAAIAALAPITPTIELIQAFRPGRPNPTHRVSM